MIVIVPYNKNWPEMFKIEAEIIENFIGKNFISIHHIGSTSVPGLSAKPQIDIDVVVKDNTRTNLESLGYKCRGELNIPFRIFFGKKSTDISYNLHVFEEDDPHIMLHIAFRDYLREHPKIRDKYGDFKKKLAAKQGSDKLTDCGMPLYTMMKNDFINDIIKKTGFKEVYINFCAQDKEWIEFHRIRKALIFDRHKDVVYDKNHQSIKDPASKHFVLYKGVEIIGTASIEDRYDGSWILRTIAIDKPFQKRGYGALLLALVEKWIKRQKGQGIYLNAAPNALEFYKSQGYLVASFDDKPMSADSIQMKKQLN